MDGQHERDVYRLNLQFVSLLQKLQNLSLTISYYSDIFKIKVTDTLSTVCEEEEEEDG